MIEGAIRTGGVHGLGGELPGQVHYGLQGPPGGHYIPTVVQLDEKTAEISFTPSSEDMPPVNSVRVELPVGPQGEKGADGTVSFDALTDEQIEKLRGPQGQTGPSGQDGEDGGYYTPAVTQPSDNTLSFAFTPSKSDMPTVQPVQVTLPAGTGSGGNVDLNWLDPEDGEVFTVIVPEATLTGISASYSGGDVLIGTALSALVGIVVNATYSDGSTATVTDYSLSGEIGEGSNTITVSYGGMTATFEVTGEAEEEQEQIGQEGRTVIGDDGYVYLDVTTLPIVDGNVYYIDRSVASSGFATIEFANIPMVADTTSEVLFKDKFTYLGTSYAGIKSGTVSPEVQYGYGYDGEGGSVLIRIPYSDYESVGATRANFPDAIALHTRYLPIKLKDSYNTYSLTEEAIDAATYYVLPTLADDGFYYGYLYISNGGTNTGTVSSNMPYLCNYGGICSIVGKNSMVTGNLCECYNCNGDERQRLNVRVPEGAIADATTLDGWKAFLKSRLPIEWYGD